MLETLTEALVRFRGEGYGAELYATPEGHLACRACNTVGDPSTIRIDHTVRFEGNTDPGDEAILLAITCECGIRGLYTSAYGPNATPEDGAVLRGVAARRSNVV